MIRRKFPKSLAAIGGMLFIPSAAIASPAASRSHAAWPTAAPGWHERAQAHLASQADGRMDPVETITNNFDAAAPKAGWRHRAGFSFVTVKWQLEAARNRLN